MDYRTCAYQVTCYDLGNVENCSDVTCGSGCFCSNGKVLEDGVCVHPNMCPSKEIFPGIIYIDTSNVIIICDWASENRTCGHTKID